MSDDLKKLQAALRQATPEPDSDAKAAALAAAQESFDRIQGSQSEARPIPEAPQNAGPFWKGPFAMFNKIKLRPALYVTSCLVVAGAAFVTYEPWRVADPAIQNDGTVLTGGQQDPLERKDRTASVDDLEVKVGETEEADFRDEEFQREPIIELAEEQPAPAPSKYKAENRSNYGADALRKQVAQSKQSAGRTREAEKPATGLAATNGVLSSIVAQDQIAPEPYPKPGDQFEGEPENPLKITVEEPVSTFSIDVDTASYAYIRNSILEGRLPNADAVRIEEMVNYFPYNYAAPDISEAPFSTQLNVITTPWNPDTKLIHIGIQGAKPAVEDRPPLNLVFLIDTSGSMQDANKLPLLKQSFRLLLNELRPEDQVAIVTYAGSAGTVLEPTSAANRSEILASLNRLSAGGSTAGQAGLQQAYALAEQMAEDGDIGRVLLATDGDFNVGISDPEALKTFVEKKRETGTYLSVFGFGQGNYRDDMMQTLAQNGNGTAAYIDTLAEAQKVLVDQVSGALFPIANDVKIQVEFNPALIAEYRLIGYETRALNREDFNNDKVDAGEIGAGHAVTAIYEITPVGSPAIKNDPLRYQTETVADTGTGELGFLKLRYKKPGEDTSKLITQPIQEVVHVTPPAEAHFAAAIAGFGQILKGSNYTGDWTLEDAAKLARSFKGEDKFGYRAEAIRLMQLAEGLE
ncbi:MAG: VWA domain-containing protein [Rhodobacteraceae bacterium]|nr:VWA domain-containing protein [Paracoccaceae bacterium]